MYGNGSGINAYRQINVTTADPKRLVLMCYEGAIGSLKFPVLPMIPVRKNPQL